MRVWVLRLWATSGELILAGIAYVLDWKGAMRGGGRRAAAVCEEPATPTIGTSPLAVSPGEARR